jgi:Ca2+-binding RTX toxin-like protein
MDTLSTLTSNRASITLPFVLLGTDDNDTLVGSVPGSTISGLGGNDDLQGIGAGNVISAGVGNDTLLGGDGTGNVLSKEATHSRSQQRGNFRIPVSSLVTGANPF